MSTPDAPMAGTVIDPVEVARFAAELDEDVRREGWLFLGQTTMLLVVIVVVGVLVVVQRA